MGMTADKEALFALLLEREGIAPAPAIAPCEVAAGAPQPLSYAQRRLWFLQQLEPDSPAYNLPRAFRVGGKLDVSLLERTLGEIVRRHEVLRTTFETVGGSQVQLIHPAAPLSVPVVELSQLPEPEREERVRALAAEEAQRPFDLARGPLLRVRLLRLKEDEHVALFTLHHIVSDGWSTGVLMREVQALYAAYREGRPTPLAVLPVQYADFARWQREWLSGPLLERQLAYWRERLRGAPDTLDLPTDRLRPACRLYRGAIHGLRLPTEQSAALKDLSLRQGTTLFMTLLAAFKLLLYHYARCEDIVVGSPVAGRTRAEVEPLIGFFVNTLVLRTDLSGDPTFAELLGRVRETALGAYAHQDLPFEKLVEELQPERDLGKTPLFQVAFTLQQRPREGFSLPGLSLTSLGSERGTTQYDLALNMVEAGEDLSGSLEYDADLFDASTVARLAAHFETLLREAAARPAARLSEILPALGAADSAREEAERRQYEDFLQRKVAGMRRRGGRNGVRA